MAASCHAFSPSVLTAVFPGEPGLAGFIGAKGDGSSGDNWSHKTCKAPVKSSPPTNQCFTSQMHFLSPNQQRQSTEGKPCCHALCSRYVYEHIYIGCIVCWLRVRCYATRPLNRTDDNMNILAVVHYCYLLIAC